MNRQNDQLCFCSNCACETEGIRCLHGYSTETFFPISSSTSSGAERSRYRATSVAFKRSSSSIAGRGARIAARNSRRFHGHPSAWPPLASRSLRCRLTMRRRPRHLSTSCILASPSDSARTRTASRRSQARMWPRARPICNRRVSSSISEAGFLRQSIRAAPSVGSFPMMWLDS